MVGATIHTGSADAGHYWSYINTKRGMAEVEESDQWVHTQNDPWMEFNDSTVRDLDYKKVSEDGFGGEEKSSGWSAFGSSFGKSAYMLVYERREKKPVKLVVEKETEGAEYDAEKEEYTKMVSFKDASVPTGNCPIYQNVLEDNAKFEFENDIYSDEFFNFTTDILNSVAKMDVNSAETKSIAIQAEAIGRKVALDIVAHCYDNKSLE